MCINKGRSHKESWLRKKPNQEEKKKPTEYDFTSIV